MNKTYSSVVEMVNDIAEPDFAEAFAEQIARKKRTEAALQWLKNNPFNPEVNKVELVRVHLRRRCYKIWNRRGMKKCLLRRIVQRFLGKVDKRIRTFYDLSGIPLSVMETM
jgi:hypothetical protein